MTRETQVRERLLKTIASVYKQKAVSDNAECVEMSTLQHNKKRHGGEEIIRVIMSAKIKGGNRNLPFA